MSDDYGRASSRRRGKEGEERMYALMMDLGVAKKVPDMWDNPDFTWTPYDVEVVGWGPYAVECKSIVHHAKNYVGRIKISREQWDETKDFCRVNSPRKPIVMVEVNIRASPIKIYYILTNEQVEAKMSENHACFTVWEIIKDGIRIDQ